MRVFSVSMCSLIASCKLSVCGKSQTIAEIWKWNHTNCDQYFLHLIHLMEQGQAPGYTLIIHFSYSTPDPTAEILGHRE